LVVFFSCVNEFTWFPDRVRDDGLEQVAKIKQAVVCYLKTLKHLDPYFKWCKPSLIPGS
jgi:hypothetical protein